MAEQTECPNLPQSGSAAGSSVPGEVPGGVAADAALVDATDLTALAAEAYVYGFPLVFDLQQAGRFTRQGIGSLSPAPFNRFSHAAKLAGPGDRFVSINNDTLYSIAQLDLGGGPLLS
jgi:hypothetical protein